MRIILVAKEGDLIESDNRFSTTNHRLRIFFSIELAILEKRLTLDNSLNLLKYAIYNFTDLKSCYDWQLPNLRSIAEELIRKRKSITLCAKIMLRFKKYARKGYDTSRKYNSRDQTQLSETG